MKFVLVSISTFIVFVQFCQGSEPYCRQFEYDEKMLSKMIRAEIAMETLTKNVENMESILKKMVDSAGERGHVVFGEIIQKASLDGGWTDWSVWTECTTTCGVGIQSRYRSCDNPARYLKGKPCEGPPSEYRSCSTQPCHDVGPVVVSGEGRQKVGFTVRDPNSFKNGAMVFSLTTTNYGNHFDATRGRFVCAVPGLYLFSATILGSSSSKDTYCWIKVGLTAMTLAYGQAKETGTYQSGSASLVHDLKAGDEVYLGDCSSSDIGKFDWNTHFTGVLIQ